MADTGPAGRSRKAAVGDHGDGGVKPHPHQHGCRKGKLPHPGATLGAFVADDENASGLDLSVLKVIAHLLFRIEYHCRPAVMIHHRLHAALFDHRPVGREVAVQHSKASVGEEGIIRRMYDLVIDRKIVPVKVLPQSPPETRGTSGSR